MRDKKIDVHLTIENNGSRTHVVDDNTVGFSFKKNTKLARLLAIIAQYGFPIRMSFLVSSIVAVSMNKIPL